MNDVQVCQVKCEDTIINYFLVRKNVKNINLRVTIDGKVSVSANRRVPRKYIDEFIIKKQDMIINALQKFSNMRADMEKEQNAPKKVYSDEEIRLKFKQICDKIYPCFIEYGVVYPQIKIRSMKSQWGSCQPTKCIITLNSRLMGFPDKCIEYVVVHEFSHFIHPNHSKEFYSFVEKIMPDWKQYRDILNKIY